MHLSLARGAPVICLLQVVKVSAQDDVIQGEPGLVYPLPKQSSIVGGARGVNVDNG
jgi:hypothetical protein